MKKISFNEICKKRLSAQAEEARLNGLTKLADNLEDTIKDDSDAQKSEYSYCELQDDVNTQLWKITGQIIKYYQLKSVDVSKMDELIGDLTKTLLQELEENLQVDKVVKGPLEPKLFGEKE